MSKTSKIVSAFEKGRTLTSDQIRSKFGVANPTAHIAYIRKSHNVVASVKRGKTYYGFRAA